MLAEPPGFGAAAGGFETVEKENRSWFLGFSWDHVAGSLFMMTEDRDQPCSFQKEMDW
jgi:hypothetical protein